MESIAVSNRREFIDAVIEEDLAISKEGADELWDIWLYRYRGGADEDYLIFIPEWMADNDFGRQWPFMFGGIEYDDESKGAVLFRDLRMVDPSIVENRVWSKVELSDALHKVDITDINDYVDDPGKAWIARSQFTAFEMVDDDDE